MAFLDDIGKIFTCDFPIQFGDNGVIISSHKGVKKLTPTEIIVRVDDKKVCVKGENLTVIYLSVYEIYVKGDVKEVAIDD